jgi:hypothetical protein
MSGDFFGMSGSGPLRFYLIIFLDTAFLLPCFTAVKVFPA